MSCRPLVLFFWTACVALSTPAPAAAHVVSAAQVAPGLTVEVVAPDGRVFRQFPVASRETASRALLQAERGARYQIRLRNTSGVRLGVVIAVDGRNIINGAKSELARAEPMYVLEPWMTHDYSGWRASLAAINEFYFTDWSESYAEAFGDRTARGVIAVAVYREQPAVVSLAEGPAASPIPSAQARSSEAAREKPAARSSSASGTREDSPGTGYGERREERAVEVEFSAAQRADARLFIKYEWRETLCRRGVLACGEKNRFWDEATLGFAPPPPPRR